MSLNTFAPASACECSETELAMSRAAYRAHRDPSAWLHGELDRFLRAETSLCAKCLGVPDSLIDADLTGPAYHEDAGASELTDQLLATLVAAEEQLCALSAQTLDPRALTAFEVRIHNGRHSARAIYPTVPNPVALLALATSNCQAGDTVEVTYRFAGGESRVVSEQFPFGMPGALRLSVPA